MIKIAYLTVSPADCPEDPGLLSDDCSRLLCFKPQIHKLSIWWAAESYLCPCPPRLSGPWLISGEEMPLYCWFGPSSSVPNRTLIYWSKQPIKVWTVNRPEHILRSKDLLWTWNVWELGVIWEFTLYVQEIFTKYNCSIKLHVHMISKQRDGVSVFSRTCSHDTEHWRPLERCCAAVKAFSAICMFPAEKTLLLYRL